MAKPIKMLELHYQMIHFLINVVTLPLTTFSYYLLTQHVIIKHFQGRGEVSIRMNCTNYKDYAKLEMVKQNLPSYFVCS